MLRTRIITAAVLLPLLLGGLFFLPQYWWACLLLLLLLAGAMEWAALFSWKRGTTLMFSLVLLVSAGNVYPDVLASEVSQATLGLSVLFWCVVVPFWLYRGWKVGKTWMQALCGWVVLLPTWLALVLMQSLPWVLLAVLGVVWVADSAAYFAGHQWGRRKLAPAISPGKTWEGVAGAAFAVAVYYLLVWNLGFANHASQNALIAGLLVCVMFPLSILGDLFESSIKRQAGVKDSGWLLPGHGGVLDRIDALTSTLPLAALVFPFLLPQS